MCMCDSVLFGCIRSIEVARSFWGGGGAPWLNYRVIGVAARLHYLQLQ